MVGLLGRSTHWQRAASASAAQWSTNFGGAHEPRALLIFGSCAGFMMQWSTLLPSHTHKGSLAFHEKSLGTQAGTCMGPACAASSLPSTKRSPYKYLFADKSNPTLQPIFVGFTFRFTFEKIHSLQSSPFCALAVKSQRSAFLTHRRKTLFPRHLEQPHHKRRKRLQYVLASRQEIELNRKLHRKRYCMYYIKL